MSKFKYFFRLLFILNIVLIPGYFIKVNFSESEYLSMTIWIILLISNLYCLWEYFKLFGDKNNKHSDPIEDMKNKI